MKSKVTDYLDIMTSVYLDAVMRCSADVSDLRDLETIRSRVEKEGLSFLTITLPRFAADLERSLALGYIDPTFFREFKKNGSIPAFLQGMTGRLFDDETGRMKDNEYPSINGGDSCEFHVLVGSIRQVCLLFKKIEIDCTPARVCKALESFVSIEHSFETFSVPDESFELFKFVSLVLWSDIIRPFRVGDLLPRHGPGATAERVSGNQKYRWLRWHERLEPYFPAIGTAYSIGVSGEPYSEEFDLLTLIPREQEQPVRVTPVPKTLKGPRIIAIEPCCMQYTQQAIRAFLYSRIQANWRTKGHVNFTDQSINQRLAMSASADGQLATIDLSDASDRVPHDLVLDMFDWHPEFRDVIDACRSTMAQLPNGTLVGPLKKFASMGSALCFPIEAMYFYTICVVALIRAQNLPETRWNILSMAQLVYVYGDDIIVPSAYADVVLDHLRKYNCKVNSNKTFLSGSFRESCGTDAFDGYEVTPTYLRQERPENKQQASQIISWVASANHLYRKGYWQAAQSIFEKVERIIGDLPYVSENSELLGRISFVSPKTLHSWNQRSQQCRWNSDYQRLEVRGWVANPIYRTDRLEGYGALTKCFIRMEDPAPRGDDSSYQVSIALKRGTTPETGVSDLLDRTALHGAVTLKRRWASPE